MALKLRKGGVFQTITGLKIFASGAWRTIVNVKIYEGGAWRDVANFVSPPSGMTASANPTFVSVATGFSSATTPSTIVTPSGGLAPYSYSWAVNTVPDASTALTPTSARTVFRCSTLNPGDDSTGTATCTVTDSLGSTATANVTVTFARS